MCAEHKWQGMVMTRNDDRLEMLARDLASVFGEDDALVTGIRPAQDKKPPFRGLGHKVWRSPQRYAFKHARLAKLGIGNAA
jgi:hypothetical protein